MSHDGPRATDILGAIGSISTTDVLGATARTRVFLPVVSNVAERPAAMARSPAGQEAQGEDPIAACAIETMDSQWVTMKSMTEPAYDAVWEWVNPDTLWNHRMPKQRVRNGAWIMYPVEVLHESSPKVFKIITVMQQKNLEVIIDRRCLFAFDIINGLFVATPQQPGIKCPCCNKTQAQVNLELESGNKDKIW